eukprot:6640745-Prymnesium_polylepis.1
MASPRKKTRPKAHPPGLLASDDLESFEFERNALEKQREAKLAEQAEQAELEAKLHGKSRRELGAMHIDVIEDIFNCQEQLEQWRERYEANQAMGVKNRCSLTRGAGPMISAYEAERAEGRTLQAALRKAEKMRKYISTRLGLDDAKALEQDLVAPQPKWPAPRDENANAPQHRSVPLAAVVSKAPAPSSKPKFSFEAMTRNIASLYGGGRAASGSTTVGVSVVSLEVDARGAAAAAAAAAAARPADDQSDRTQFTDFSDAGVAPAAPAAMTYTTEAFTERLP